jgi:hypothetical protein
MLDDIDKIRKDVQEYLEIKLDLIRLHTAENISKIVSRALSLAILGYLLFFILLFLSFAAAYFFASLLNSNELGFLCVAGFYVVVLAIILVLRKRIIERPVIKAIVKLFFTKLNDDDKTS